MLLEEELVVGITEVVVELSYNISHLLDKWNSLSSIFDLTKGNSVGDRLRNVEKHVDAVFSKVLLSNGLVGVNIFFDQGLVLGLLLL
jgi:tetrahydromethanopterin S-methyltransferase subunit G